MIKSGAKSELSVCVAVNNLPVQWKEFGTSGHGIYLAGVTLNLQMAEGAEALNAGTSINS